MVFSKFKLLRPLRIIIVDDDPKSSDILVSKIHKCDIETSIIAICQSADEGVRCIKEQDPDLVFLDIEMPDKTGFELIEEIQDFQGSIIFCTAYDQYTIKAIRAGAHDYLLKPIDLGDLKEAIQRFFDKHETPKPTPPKQSLRQGKLGIPTMEGVELLNQEDIYYCTSSGNYTYVHLKDKSHVLISRTLKEIEHALPTDVFVRIHRSCVVNINHIQKYIKGKGGQILLTNGVYLEVATRKKDMLLHLLKSL